MPAQLNIIAEVMGVPELDILSQKLQQLKDQAISYGLAKKLMTANAKIEIETMKQSNVMLKARANMNKGEMTQLVKQSVLQEQYQYQFKNRFETEKSAYALREQYKLNGIKITQKEAIIATQANDAIIKSEIAKKQAYNDTRKALMGASISMFVLNITMSQFATSLKPFVKGNEDAEVALKNVSNALMFSMAPLQMYMALQMISIGLSKQQKVAFLGVATSLGAIFFFYSAITSKTPAMRAAYAAIAVVLTAVAIASWAAAYGTAALKAALTGNIVPLVMVTAALAMAIGGIAAVTAPKAQTLTGHRKRVRKGGEAILDDDEVVMRESKDGTRSGGGGDTHIYLPDSYNGSMADAKITANSVRQMMNTGYGTIKYQRRVVTGG